MPEIVPTITAFTPEEYKTQLDKIKFAPRLHLDFTLNDLAPSRTVNLIQAYWPEKTWIDIHLMYQKPTEHIETLISLAPKLAILHAEADGDLPQLFEKLKAVDIRAGLALLPETTVESVKDLIKKVDHVLVFGGRLGYQGSELQTEQLAKIAQVKKITPLEVGWDGGVHDDNVMEVAAAGADVINVGGYMQKAKNPESAYDKLKKLVE